MSCSFREDAIVPRPVFERSRMVGNPLKLFELAQPAWFTEQFNLRGVIAESKVPDASRATHQGYSFGQVLLSAESAGRRRGWLDAI